MVAATNQGAHTGTEFVEGKGFNEIIVSAHIEAARAVVYLVFGREDKNRSVFPLGAEPLENRPAIHPWEHEIEHYHIIVRAFGLQQPRTAITGHIDDKAFSLQALSKRSL